MKSTGTDVHCSLELVRQASGDQGCFNNAFQDIGRASATTPYRKWHTPKHIGFELNPPFVAPSFLLGRDAFDEDPEVMAFPADVAQQQCATAQKRAEEKLAERLEDVDVI